jgi:hypothetical protein
VNAGVLGVPITTPLQEVRARVSTHNEKGHELTTAVDVAEQHTLSGSVASVEGRVLQEDIEEQEAVTVEDGSILVGEQRCAVQRWADFAGVTATDDHEGFLLVDSSDAVFAFDVVGDSILEAAEIDLAAFVDEQQVFALSTAGSPAVGPVDSVTAHGPNVLDDEDIGVGEHIEQAIRSGHLSQVRVRYDSPNYGIVRCYLAGSGYVEVYEPDLETPEFLELVANDVLPFASGGDGT